MANSYHIHSRRKHIAENPHISEGEKARYFADVIYLQWCGEYEREHHRIAPSFDEYRRITGAGEEINHFEQTGAYAFTWKRLTGENLREEKN